MRAFFSWSGGKDSMLALHRALDAGYRVEVLLAMFDESGERSRSHAISPALMQAQADALGIPLVMRNASWADYEAVFTATVARVRIAGHHTRRCSATSICRHTATGKKRSVPPPACRRCCRCGTRTVARWPTRSVRIGWRARVVCVDARWLDASYCGVEYDAGFIARLPEGVDACGENGEFHTFVYDGPRFARAVPHRVAAIHDVRIEAPFSAHYHTAELVGG